MGHDIVVCPECGEHIMEGRNDWDCDKCGWSSTPKQQYTTVKSSNIKQVGYNKKDKNLFVVFNNGGEYKYFNFPEKKYEEFLSAKSIGKFFHSQINKKYKFEKV